MDDAGPPASAKRARMPQRNTGLAKKRGGADDTPARRSTNACHRCKSKKIKCSYSGATLNTCVACDKAGTACIFEIGEDGVPRGTDYVAALEARIGFLEGELRRVENERTIDRPSDTDVNNEDEQLIAGTVSHVNVRAVPEYLLSHYRQPIQVTRRVSVSRYRDSKVTLFTMVHASPDSPRAALPSDSEAERLFQTAYTYTQARYCMADWHSLRKFHQKRENICFASLDADVETQVGAFFVWMTYAIGAQLMSTSELSDQSYYTRAADYLQPVLELQDIRSIQALLMLVQYYFRAPKGPTLWQLVGAALRLCVELGYHLRPSRKIQIAPYDLELRKRLFWCAYCFDRIVSIMSRRPFGIRDEDISCDNPADVNDDVTSSDTLHEIQTSNGAQGITSMSAVLHNLHIYRIRSMIMTKYSSPHSPQPAYEDVVILLDELNAWRRNAPRSRPESSIPLLSSVRIDYLYFQAILLLLRPILSWPAVEDTLLLPCASLSAEACESARQLSLSPNTQSSLLTVYNCFRCGITFLQCLNVHRNILPTRRAMRAISSCSSALAVYTRTLTLASPFLDLFDILSDHFIGGEDELPRVDLHGLLQQITSSDPTEIPEILRSLNKETQDVTDLIFDQTTPDQYDFLLGIDPASAFGMDFMPFDMAPVEAQFTNENNFTS